MSPTPWKIVTRGAVGEDDFVMQVIAADGGLVCDNECYYPHAVDEDDMRLIVQAVNYLRPQPKSD